MKDSKITKKHTLATRVLIVVILLLVIPLLLQSLFLYRQEYQAKLIDVQTELKVLVNERAHLIEELIQMNWAILDSWVAPENIGFRGGPIERIVPPAGVREHFLLVSLSGEALLVGRTEFDMCALVIPIPFRIIASDMPRAFPIHISLIGSSGKVLWENTKGQKTEDLIASEDPIMGTDFLIRLEVDRKAIKDLHLASYYLRFASLLFFVGVIGGGAVYFFTRRIEKPLKSLGKTMQRVSEGASHARYTPDWMGFEINALGLQFNETLDQLLMNEQLAEKERLKREILANEFRIGHEIQSSLLLSHVSGFPGVDIAASYYAAQEVNGDFYELFRFENGNLLIAVCDTAGKGISACLFSLGLRSILRSLATVLDDLEEIVKRANAIYMADAHQASMFSTLWIGIYDPKTKRLTYCSQGHPPAFLLRNDKIEELWTEGIALGASSIDTVAVCNLKLKEGDSLVLYTDGIIEAHDTDSNLFGKARFQKCLLEMGPKTAQQMADQIIEEVNLFSRGGHRHDDMTLLIMRILGV